MNKLIAIIIALLFGSNASVLATTYHVDANNAVPAAPYTNWVSAATNIQDAVDLAGSGDTVLVTNGTYWLDAEIAVANAIRIESMHGPGATIAVAVNSNRCFNLGTEAFLGGFTITNGYVATDGGGITCEDGTVMVSNCVFSGNSTDANGGGMYNGTAYDCRFFDNTANRGAGVFSGAAHACLFSGNTADFEGGGIYSGTASDCIFTNNTSLNSGGGTHNVQANNCTYIDNTATSKGGGFSIFSNAAIPSNCVFIGNTANVGGGTYYASSVIDCAFSNNIAFSSGGAVYQGATAINCTFAGNIASNGSGGAIVRAYPYDCFFTNNWADDNGGAIYETGASNCTFIGNHAGSSGGAKSWWNTLIQDCVFISNTAGVRGGAVNDGQLYNCIFYGNHSGDRGGAVSEADLYNCVLYNNTASDEGGGMTQGSARNSIIWSNSAPLGNDAYDATVIRCCLSDAVIYGTLTDGITDDPLFVDAPSGDFHLQSTSPCIDGGSNGLAFAFYDFDGIPRPLDGDANGTAIVDIGCHEHLIATADSDGDTMPDGWEIDNGLNATVDDAGGNPDADPHDNLAEYIVGTDPTNGASFFKITNAMDTASGFVVEWDPSVGDRAYSVLWTNELTGGFQSLETGIEFPQNSYTDSLYGVEDAGFYRVDVQLK